MKRRPIEPTLREKAGQMILAGFRGFEISDQNPVARDLAEGNLGGVILFDEETTGPSVSGRNIKSPEQLKALVASLQKRSRAPLFIAIDQEGGAINRLKPEYGFPPTLSHEELGTINRPEETFAHADKIATTLSDLGVNLNLAPVVDMAACADNPIIKKFRRSFSPDPEIVSRHAMEFAKAHAARRVITCPKHFPGHGSARGDTHSGWVDVTEFWSERELIPYQRLIKAGLCEIVMTAHVFNARLDPDRPATLSQPVLRGLLRQRLGFDGVIVSDALEMQAIAGKYGFEQAVELGINAGLDLLLLGNTVTWDPRIAGKATSLICRLVEKGRIPAARIDESWQRLQNLKRKFHFA